MRNTRLVRPLLALVAVTVFTSLPAGQARPKLSSADIDDITQLVTLEDTRRFDDATLGRLVHATHPEVRRRAILSVGRIVDTRGRALLESVRTDPNPEIAATVAFATGQLKDPTAVSWLAGLLADAKTPPAVAKEAACALGKIRSPEARTALGEYLSTARATPASAPAIGEALLAMGRFTTPGDIAPIVRWATSPDVEVRWRATWALFRLKDPAAIPHLLRLADDKSGDVRFWAVRGLAPTVVDAAKLDRAVTAKRLRDGTRDPDRRVRTEALRALGLYDDDESFGVVLSALDSPDTWMSVSAAEAMTRFKDRAAVIAPRLVVASAPDKPMALRQTALAPLVALAPDAAVEAAAALVSATSTQSARTAGAQALGRLGAPGRARLDALSADPATRDLLPPPAGARAPRQPDPPRTPAEYRRIVETWIVPDYNGAPKPRAIFDTPKGPIELELYPGDAPLGMEHFLRVVTSGSIVGTEFSRVVPNFVAQQAGIRDASTLRDEVNRHGLTRGNLSWASAGLDTGRPGYTLGNTPQPHNEGDFTALGHVVNGLDVLDHLELGDRITAARMLKR